MNGLWISSGANSFAHMRKQIIHYADSNFPFLHDTVITCYQGRLLAAWYNCTEDEIVGHTVIRGCWSGDNGLSWSAPEIICEDPTNQTHMVPVTFSEWQGRLFAYVTTMTGHDIPTGYVCLEYNAGTWTRLWRREDLLLLNTLPQPMGGEWIAGGRIAEQVGQHPTVPAVAISKASAPADWQIIRLPGAWNTPGLALPFPETAVLVGQTRLDAIVRNDTGAALAFSSTDRGRTWSGPADVKMPIASAKIYGGSLPDGRQYLIYNEETPAGDRSRLVLALRQDENSPFSRVWLLADGYDADLQAGPFWHYPCACVAGGCLHISCTASSDGVQRHAALYSVPLEELK